MRAAFSGRPAIKALCTQLGPSLHKKAANQSEIRYSVEATGLCGIGRISSKFDRVLSVVVTQVSGKIISSLRHTLSRKKATLCREVDR
jgi:hypothetical protein